MPPPPAARSPTCKDKACKHVHAIGVLDEFAYLRERKQVLGDRHNILHLLNRRDAVLDSLRVLRTRRVEDAPDAVDVTLCPVAVRLPDALPNALLLPNWRGNTKAH